MLKSEASVAALALILMLSLLGTGKAWLPPDCGLVLLRKESPGL